MQEHACSMHTLIDSHDSSKVMVLVTDESPSLWQEMYVLVDKAVWMEDTSER